MSKILIFGGTTEGRELAEYCVDNKIAAAVSVVSDYGEELLPDSPYLDVFNGGRSKAELKAMLQMFKPQVVLDATHPYAKVITEYVSGLCEELKIQYYRIVREEVKSFHLIDPEAVEWVDTIAAAVDYLNQTEGAVLVTTGSKQIAEYQQVLNYQQRLFVRVLPSLAAIEQCQEIGLKGSQIIGMQGPFSKELNMAMINQLQIKYLVTKEAGNQGGFEEKIRAAAECGVTTIVVGRPVKEDGITITQAKDYLRSYSSDKRTVYLIGAGMGGAGQFTLEALTALAQCEVIFGSPRVLESVQPYAPSVTTMNCYQSAQIWQWLERNKEVQKAAVIFSGDTGFYSGADSFVRDLEANPWKEHYQCMIYPGISSVSYLCAKIRQPWQDLRIISLHGRELDLTELLFERLDLFILLGSKIGAAQLCHLLTDAGEGGRQVIIGQRLSYPDERIITGRAKDLVTEKFHSLSVMIIKKEGTMG